MSALEGRVTLSVMHRIADGWTAWVVVWLLFLFVALEGRNTHCIVLVWVYNSRTEEKTEGQLYWGHVARAANPCKKILYSH